MNGMTFVNTPGYYYSIAYFLAAFLVNRTNKQRDDVKGWKRWIIHIVFFGGIVGFMELTDGVRQMLFIPCMMVSISMLLFYIYLCCDFGLKDAGYYCARAFICGEFAASLCWQIYFYFITIRSGDIKWFGWKWLELLGVYVSVFGVLYFLEMYLKEETEENSVNSRELITVIIITAAVFVVSNISYLDQGTLFSSRFAGEMFTIRTLVDLSGMAVLYAYHIQMRELQMKFEVDTLQNILEMQYKNYQLSQESIEIVNQKYHDMKNHLGELALMAGNQNNEEIRKYIHDMGEYMQNQSELVSCGNKNLDSLLNYLLGQAKKKLNHVEYEVRVPSDLCISAFDLNVILGNLTENAIEAAEQTKDKWMSVDIYYEKGMLSMEIKNSFQHELAVEKNKLLSTKEEKGHGIGLANVRKMVEKYQGFMDVSNTNQIFIVKVMLYL